MGWPVTAQVNGAVAALAEEELISRTETKVDMLCSTYPGFLLKALL